MVNINRIDQTNRAIDQEAFGIAFRSDDTTTSGCLIHHGQWENRTSKPPQRFWDAVAASGIGNCYHIQELPVATSGTLSELCIRSQEGAFQKVVAKLKAIFDEWIPQPKGSLTNRCTPMQGMVGKVLQAAGVAILLLADDNIPSEHDCTAD